MQWQIPIALQIGPGALLGLGMLFVKESPRWLAQKGCHKRLKRGSAILCLVRELQNVNHTCDADLKCRTFLWGVCRNARSSVELRPVGARNGASNTIKDHDMISSAVLQADLKNLGTREAYAPAKRQSVLSTSRVLPLERWLLIRSVRHFDTINSRPLPQKS
jgi:hypothetical protein